MLQSPSQTPELALFDVVITEFEARAEAPVSRIVRVFDVDEQVARALVTGLPAMVCQGVNQVRAAHFARALRSIGAQLEIRDRAGALVELAELLDPARGSREVPAERAPANDNHVPAAMPANVTVFRGSDALADTLGATPTPAPQAQRLSRAEIETLQHEPTSPRIAAQAAAGWGELQRAPTKARELSQPLAAVSEQLSSELLVPQAPAGSGPREFAAQELPGDRLSLEPLMHGAARVASQPLTAAGQHPAMRGMSRPLSGQLSQPLTAAEFLAVKAGARAPREQSGKLAKAAEPIAAPAADASKDWSDLGLSDLEAEAAVDGAAAWTIGETTNAGPSLGPPTAAQGPRLHTLDLSGPALSLDPSALRAVATRGGVTYEAAPGRARKPGADAARGGGADAAMSARGGEGRSGQVAGARRAHTAPLSRARASRGDGIPAAAGGGGEADLRAGRSEESCSDPGAGRSDERRAGGNKADARAARGASAALGLDEERTGARARNSVETAADGRAEERVDASDVDASRRGAERVSGDGRRAGAAKAGARAARGASAAIGGEGDNPSRARQADDSTSVRRVSGHGSAYAEAAAQGATANQRGSTAHARRASRASPQPTAAGGQHDEGAFWHAFTDTCAFPFRGSGIAWLVSIGVWAICASVLSVLARSAPIAGWIVMLFASSSVLAICGDYHRRCMWGVADRDGMLVQAPQLDPTHIVRQYLGASMHLVAFVFASQLPLALWLAIAIGHDGQRLLDLSFSPRFWLLAALPSFYWPMAMASASFHQRFSAVWFVTVGLRAIVRAPLPYLGVVAAGALTFLVPWLVFAAVAREAGIPGSLMLAIAGFPMAASHGVMGALSGLLMRSKSDLFA